jgi:GNAT superfamily N-acetyltransferase
MAVAPTRQRRGIGSMLVQWGLHECKLAGYRAAIYLTGLETCADGATRMCDDLTVQEQQD